MPAMTQEAVRKGNPSLFEQAILMVTNGKAAVDDSTKIKYNLGGAPSDSKGAIKPSLFTLPLACGMMGASSFAFCASKGKVSCLTSHSSAQGGLTLLLFPFPIQQR